MPSVRLLLSDVMISDETWFYDNDPGPTEAAPPLRPVERVYGLSFNDFSESDWERLAVIYQNLPHWLGFGGDECPRWFGADEGKPPYLWASVEPAGLQVHGVLLAKDWEAWDAEFRRAAAILPKKDVS